MIGWLRKLVKGVQECIYALLGYKNGRMVLRILAESMTIIAIFVIMIGFPPILAAIAEVATPGEQHWLSILVAHYCHIVVGYAAMIAIAGRGLWALWRWLRK